MESILTVEVCRRPLASLLRIAMLKDPEREEWWNSDSAHATENSTQIWIEERDRVESTWIVAAGGGAKLESPRLMQSSPIIAHFEITSHSEFVGYEWLDASSNGGADSGVSRYS